MRILGWFLPFVVAANNWEDVKRKAWEATANEAVDGFFSTGGHTNNWAVLIDTSRFWLNYRHIANTLSIYRTVKRLGIPDSNIILMLADDIACNPRNTFPATVFNSNSNGLDLYGDNIEVDFRGYDVNVANIIKVLTNRVDEKLPRSKRLLTDDRSNILVYMTGHGGEDFLKVQDNEELTSQDLADAFAQMYEKKRYHEMLFMIDTCEAESMFRRIRSPGILSVSSSRTGQPSLSHHNDRTIGVSVIDSFTYHNLETFERLNREDQKSIQSLFDGYDYRLIHSNAMYDSARFGRSLKDTPVVDFFGGVQSVELTERRLSLSPVANSEAKFKVLEPKPKIQGGESKEFRIYQLGERPLGDLIQLNFIVGAGIFVCIAVVSFI